MYPIGMFTPDHIPGFGGGVLAVHRGKLYVSEHRPTGSHLLRLIPICPLPGDEKPLVQPSYTLCKPIVLSFCEGQKLVYHGPAAEEGRSMVSFHPHDAPTPVRNEHLRPFPFPVGELALLDNRDLVRIAGLQGNLRSVMLYNRRHLPEDRRHTMATLTRLQRLDRLDVRWMNGNDPIHTTRSLYFNTAGSDLRMVAFRTPGTKQDFIVDATLPTTEFSNPVPEAMRANFSITTPPAPGQTLNGGTASPVTPPPLPTSVQPAKARRFTRSYPQHNPSFSTGRPPLRVVVPDDASL